MDGYVFNCHNDLKNSWYLVNGSGILNVLQCLERTFTTNNYLTHNVSNPPLKNTDSCDTTCDDKMSLEHLKLGS